MSIPLINEMALPEPAEVKSSSNGLQPLLPRWPMAIVGLPRVQIHSPKQGPVSSFLHPLTLTAWVELGLKMSVVCPSRVNLEHLARACTRQL